MWRETAAELVRSELRAAKIPGCSIAVVSREGATWAEGFGYADLRTKRAATPRTAYHLFSGTKLYTATAVMQLVEARKLGLDDPVAAIIPEWAGAGAVTIRQLLTHTSGLKDTLRAFLAVHFEKERAPFTMEALSRYRIAPKRPPGRKVEYRNVNYALLGEVVSRVSGRPFTAYLTDHVLSPLGIKAAFSLTDAMKPDAAVGYMGSWEPMRFLSWLLIPRTARRLFGRRADGLIELNYFDVDTAAIGGLVGPVTAFIPFVHAQLNGGEGVLSEASTRLMQTIAARGRAGIESRVGVGLGWKIGLAGGRTFLNHEGGGAGFTSETRIYPEHGIGMVIAMNRWIQPATSLTAHRICEAICDERDSPGRPV
jgi:D-alanyl-D-alanine carboxypeptidase